MITGGYRPACIIRTALGINPCVPLGPDWVKEGQGWWTSAILRSVFPVPGVFLDWCCQVVLAGFWWLAGFLIHLLWPGHSTVLMPREGRWGHFVPLPPLHLPRAALGARLAPVCWGQREISCLCTHTSHSFFTPSPHSSYPSSRNPLAPKHLYCRNVHSQVGMPWSGLLEQRLDRVKTIKWVFI